MKRGSWSALAGCVMLAITLGACGQDAEVKVSVPGDSLADLAPPPDTVVQQQLRVDTLVKQRTDTVVVEHPVVVPPETVRVGRRGAAPAVAPEERRLIDAWLTAHVDSLNRYGDRIGTMYAGGTPLFDEATGMSIDRYAYIVRNHPDMPWRVVRSGPR